MSIQEQIATENNRAAASDLRSMDNFRREFNRLPSRSVVDPDQVKRDLAEMGFYTPSSGKVAVNELYVEA